MFKDEQHIWNILFTGFFLVLAVLAYLTLHVGGRMPTYIPLFDAVLLVLATFRLTRLFLHDVIMQWLRDLFLDVQVLEDGTLMRREPSKGPRKTVSILLGCPWCFALWAGFVTSFAYFLTPYTWFFIFILAVAGLASLLQILANLLGWSAEHKKITTERL